MPPTPGADDVDESTCSAEQLVMSIDEGPSHAPRLKKKIGVCACVCFSAKPRPAVSVLDARALCLFVSLRPRKIV